jgi:hypothetical protein
LGLGNITSVDSIVVQWPDNKTTILTDVKTNQLIDLYQKDATHAELSSEKAKRNSIFSSTEVFTGVDFKHRENDFVDFNRDRLLFNMISNEGPCICTGDVNNDRLPDFYIGGAKDQAGSLFVQQKSGSFLKSDAPVFEVNKESEDTDCIFFDANGDGRQDLYVTSGGFEFSSNSVALLDRLYLNTGKGKLEKSEQLLPISTRFESTSAVAASDYDKDGDLDLFVGGRLIPFLYGAPANGYLLSNDGKGNFTDVTKQAAPQLLKLGLITDSKWVDVNNDGYDDLLVVGEWMSMKMFINENGKLVDRTAEYGLDKSNGWYHAVEIGDFNNDGFQDFVVGNHGLNSRFRASEVEPVSMYVNDFDQNGYSEQIITRYDNGVSYPIVMKQDLVAQIPSLRKKYLHFRDYTGKTITDIFTEDQLRNSAVLNAYTFETAAWINNKDGTFSKRKLPVQAQFFPVYALLVDDFNGDENLDILLGGNLLKAKPETGIYSGGYGVLIKGDANGNFEFVPATESGLKIKGEIRSLKKISAGNRERILVGKNNDHIEVLNF